MHGFLANAARIEYPAALLRSKLDTPSACRGVFDFAFDGEMIVAFCSLTDMGRFHGLHIGGPGCVGTIPEFCGQGIGLEMVRLATETLRQDVFDLSWIHYTHLAHWYMKLGYQPVLQWNSNGILQNISDSFFE